MNRYSLPFAVLLAACNWGLRPAGYAPAVKPEGASVAVRVAGEPFDRRGELYAADSLGVIIRDAGGIIVRVSWPRLSALVVDKLGRTFDLAPGGTRPVDSTVARLAAISRFPQGLDSALLTRVRQKLGQKAVHDISSADLDDIARHAAIAARRYHDRRVAIAEGYRRIGPDFPSMGEHWVHPASLMTSRIDPERPTLLAYATIAGVPALIGVGFAATTQGDDAAANAPGWPWAWHEHSGLISDESGARVGPRAPTSTAQTRVWFLHVWTSLENPAGRYMADNWALPFARAGLRAPQQLDENAARAFSLAVGGDRFVRDLLTDAALMTPGNATDVDSVIAAARLRAGSIAHRDSVSGVVSDADVIELSAVWNDLTTDLAAVLGPSAAAVLAPSHSHANHHEGHSRAR